MTLRAVPTGLQPGRASALHAPARVLESLKHEAVTGLGGVLSGFWSGIEEQVRLAALAGHDYIAVQEDRVAVMALSHRALELATRFRESIEKEFARWEAPADAPQRERSLTLMSESELEIHLAGQQITELLDHQFLHPLAQLDERLRQLSAALGNTRRRPNPLRPEVPVTAFVALFAADDLTSGLRSMVFQQFDKRLPKVLGELYDKTNAILDAASFSASAPARAHAGGSASAGRAPVARGGEADGEWVPDGGTVPHLAGSGAGDGVPQARDEGARAGAEAINDAGETAATGRVREQVVAEALASGRPLRYRDLVRDQLRAWRAREPGEAQVSGDGGQAADMPEAGVAADAAPGTGGHVLDTAELLNLASLLQGDDPAPFEKVLAGEDARPLADAIRHALLSGVRQIGFDPANTRFSSDEEDAIDLIGILFQSLFDANDLVGDARQMYGKLVVPYLKVALTDDSLFNRRSHPARRLLDAVTEACDGNVGRTPQDQETLNQAGHAVDRVVGEYQDDQAIFELAAAELRDHLDQQRRRAELTEKRAAEAIHGRERLQQARRSAAGLVASRLADRQMTAAVAHFLDRHWRHHLTQTWLRDGPDSQRHLSAINVGDAMVQVDADAAEVRGAVVAKQLLALQVPLGECYTSCGMEATAARDAMARIISALALPDTPRTVHQPQGEAAEAVDDGDDDGVLRVAGGKAALAFDPAIAARMRRLRVGQGLRLVDEEGHEGAGRIAWISPLTGRFLIVNRRGVRKTVVSPEELAVMVAEGRAQVRSVDAPFDEAMKQLWQRINAGPDDAPAAGRAASSGG
ncbi:DUF1631 domain-containing protein [Luteimonas marina]|uniref:DUF1631 domain-containing protein n=1 Tax=Luteimonas marina TaxID=488485 RepID=A0A5C5U4B4_9GAMM|nr:DUF1631 family protein [Luteimonas marina]TWT21281.1 DUF1631 domain-containing protein [Luteimonas marina]